MKIHFKHSEIINDRNLTLDFNLEVGERIALVGPNGIGKSTWLMGLKRKKQTSFLSFLDQKRLAVLGELSARDLMNLMNEHYTELWSETFFLEHLKDFNLITLLDKPINVLSGGENQVLKICFALSFKTTFFLFDEPLNHLDERRQEIFFKKLKSDCGYLFVEHKRSFIKAHCTHLISFEDNKKREVSFIEATDLLKVMTGESS